MMKEMIMLCERIDPFFVIVVLFGVAWFAVVMTGLVYGLRRGRGA
jgi:hypothetical protein